MVYTTYLWWFGGWFMALFQPHYSRSWMVRGLNQMFQSLERPTHLVPPAHLWSRSPPSHIVGSHSNPVNHSWHYGFGENRPRKPIGSPKISENLMVNHPFPHTQKKAILRIVLGYPHVCAQAHFCIGTWNWNSLKISWDLDLVWNPKTYQSANPVNQAWKHPANSSWMLLTSRPSASISSTI